MEPHNNLNKQSLEQNPKAKCEALAKEIKLLDQQIAELKKRGTNTDLSLQMNALHEYNEIKDVTQMVLGYLANVDNVTICEVHKRYDLPLD